MDAGARGRRLLQRREYKAKVSEFVPKELEDHVVYEQDPKTNLFPDGTQARVKKFLDKGTEVMNKNKILRTIGNIFKSGNPGSNYTPGGKVPATNSFEPEGEMIDEEGKSLFSTPGLDKLKKIQNFKNNADKVFGRNTKPIEKAHYEPEGETIEEADKKGKGSGTKDACYHKVKSRYSVWPSAYASGALVKCRKVGAANWGNSSKKEDFSDWKSEFIWEDGDSSKKLEEDKSPAWQRKEGKSESGGLNAKGVASYRRENPGSKLKTAVTTKPSKLKRGSKSAKRRKSFCSRMRGMKKKLTSAKTARDPDSRINKALRKWNC